ncbi:hypothetical protein LTR37_002673 [Vermiconidia calcicola]|uniref:Uncharacterized protein n=1 Tax=Vermiconidia calcicola TaxID=1690605 RepID=A0ACC3NTR4_9PEZI|nr:hypothetical protein LTR37_002673 [Vermiconidia calcicola]
MPDLLSKRKQPEPNSTPKPSKKQRRTKLSVAGQNVVTILVCGGEGDGEEQTPFRVHSNLLTANSTVFGAKIDLDDAYTESKPLIVDEVSAETFNTFVLWLYAGSSPTDSLLDVDEIGDLKDEFQSEEESGEESESESESEDHKEKEKDVENDNASGLNYAIDHASTAPVDGAASESGLPALSDGDAETTNSPWYSTLDRKGRVLARIVDVYIFAFRYKALKLRKAAMLSLQRCIDVWGVVPCPTILKHALDILEQDAPLFRYLVVCTANYTDYMYEDEDTPERLATLPSSFLANVLGIIFARMKGEKKVHSMERSWCEFHEHETEAERKACERNRPKDADVKRVRKGRKRSVSCWASTCPGLCSKHAIPFQNNVWAPSAKPAGNDNVSNPKPGRH